MICTSYLGKMKEMESGDYKIIIMRYLPKWVSGSGMLKNTKIFHMPELAPSAKLLGQYQRMEISWNDFAKRYSEEINSSDILERMTKFYREKVAKEKGTKMILICCEKDEYSCHRHLLGLMIKEKYGISVQELFADA